jgi:heptaprenyl diphosphate synthase
MSGRVQKLARLALLLALAVVIHTAEALLPVTAVWFRFGFANIIGLATLYLFGFKDALLLTLGRVFVASLISGAFGSPAFLLSLAGSVTAMLAMGLAHWLGPRILSPVGISVIGAVTHNSAQLALAYLIIVHNEAVFLLLPVMILAAVATGCLNGLATRFFVDHFRKIANMA